MLPSAFLQLAALLSVRPQPPLQLPQVGHTLRSYSISCSSVIFFAENSPTASNMELSERFLP
jgi:hypothetical protein